MPMKERLSQRLFKNLKHALKSYLFIFRTLKSDIYDYNILVKSYFKELKIIRIIYNSPS